MTDLATARDLTAARRQMIDAQLRTYDVNALDVLRAVEDVPREAFVPPALRALAYSDVEIDLGGRRLMTPMVFARLLQAADLKPHERALDVAGGTGYPAAVLARLAGGVVALEEPALAGRARECLAAAGAAGVEVVAGPLDAGHAAGAPYDVVLVNGAVERGLDALLEQLAEGGRLVAVEGLGRAGRAVVHLKRAGTLARRAVFDASAPPLAPFRAVPGFAF